MTGVRVVSLKVDTPRSIPGDGAYHVVRFPYTAEPADPWGMHAPEQPDGYRVSSWTTDDRSGLIWPAADGWGTLTAVIFWEPGAYDELRDRYVRDPLGLATGYDSTATEHRPPSPGMQCFHKSHELFVRCGVPLALLVAHDHDRPVRLTLAELKLAIHPVEEP
ncbi:hypothetical protein [Streptomyces sp. MNP-20]|uniref:hypothetical protein n=1 Tax=Streptomyces sp. MNP-20 TaxID=2721165 RepID=UPI00155572FD|nr:hypothetical protein [Streptomyces sp. MNP-20]